MKKQLVFILIIPQVFTLAGKPVSSGTIVTDSMETFQALILPRILYFL